MSEVHVGARAGRGPVPFLNEGPLARWLAPSSESRVERIPVIGIQPRPLADHGDGDPATFAALVVSIRVRGIVEPLLLRPAGPGRFGVVCGARRLRAARLLGMDVVPAIVRELTDVDMLLTGAWQALLRLGIGDPDAEPLVRRLVAGGLDGAEAAALVAAIPRRRATPPAPVETAGEPPAMRLLDPGRPHRAVPLGRVTSAGLPAADGLLLPFAHDALRLLADVNLPGRSREMAA